MNTLLVFHIAVALMGMSSTIYAFVSPSKGKLFATYAFIAATLVSGFALVLSHPGHEAEACINGLVYFTVVGYVAVAARRKLMVNSNAII